MDDVQGSNHERMVGEGGGGKLRGDMILAKFLVEALRKKAKGDTVDYLTISDQLKPANLNELTMQRWLTVFRRCISLLSDDMLLNASLVFPWVTCNDSLTTLYIEYLEDLVSTHPSFIQPVLHNLCSRLLNPDHSTDGVYFNIHDALRSVLNLVPRAHSSLVRVLESQAPYKGREPKYHETFVRNCLRVTMYCPDVKTEILKLITLKMLQIDVELPPSIRDNDGDQVVVSTGDEEMQFDVEMETANMATPTCITNTKARPTSSSCSLFPPSLIPSYSCTSNIMKDCKAESVDIMMTIMFEYIQYLTLAEDNKLDLMAVTEAYELFLQVFEEQILLTHGSSHVQFLLFKLCSYDESISTHFLDYLWNKFQDINMAAVVRQACALYISSFIARSKFVSVSTVKLCLSKMAEWIHLYLRLSNDNHARPDVAKHGPFYALCQAVFYIIVFRHSQIMESGKGQQFLMMLNLSQMIASKLNPLKVCLSSVVEKFASVVCKLEVAFCYSIIEQNKRLMLPVTASSTSMTTSASYEISTLATFFPFDPYCLNRSEKFIIDLYQHWKDDDVVKENGLFASNKNTSIVSDVSGCEESPSSFGSLLYNFTTP